MELLTEKGETCIPSQKQNFPFNWHQSNSISGGTGFSQKTELSEKIVNLRGNDCFTKVNIW